MTPTLLLALGLLAAGAAVVLRRRRRVPLDRQVLADLRGRVDREGRLG